MTSYAGNAIVTQHGKRVPVTCDYRAEQDILQSGDSIIPGLKSWEGTLYAETRLDLGEAQLELPDGSTGTIILHSIETVDVTSYGDHWRGALLGGPIYFVGTGPAPDSPSDPIG